MKASCEHKWLFQTDAITLYHAWLNGELHTAMTGGKAECSEVEGASFSAWDGYITGHNIELTPSSYVKQAWRTAEFSEFDEDSLLQLWFEDKAEGCEMRLLHTNIPNGQTQYEQGWIDNYFNPMRAYFG